MRGSAVPDGGVAFVFPGQGSQWPGMGLELWDSSPVFAAAMRACEEALAPFAARPLREVLADPVELGRIEVLQQALFAVSVSLAALWRSYGVEPAVVVGHSQGEVAAAYVAGALSLEDAARVAAVRSRALARLAGRTGLVSVLLAADEVRERIARWDERLFVGAFNGPASTIVSGEAAALDELVAACEADGVRARRVPVAVASHSAYVEELREHLLADLADIAPRDCDIPFCSAAQAEIVSGSRLDPDYWYSNLRRPVQFEQATRLLLGRGVTAFVEASPHPVLTVPVEQTAADADVAVIGSLRRDEGDLARFQLSLGEAHVHGVAVDWDAAFAGAAPDRVELPTYAFQRRRFWLGEDPETAPPAASRRGGRRAHAARARPHPRCGGARSRVGAGGAGAAIVPRAGLRLAGGGRAAQPAGAGDRRAAALDARLRPPDAQPPSRRS